ncbi:hypothetical protein LTS16_023597 [Friedmanniomyces endolithicus]|uniref:Uncharacterized protein n=1 Tax=Friedmanniomyces endolithicus TaxID=329885 RepID=A0AAN6FAB9_9PEZI|nr:hypothetical protein LTS00_016053 [Friedmanniomyces endolithicus]KAK0274230.1 hypothetical protein LTR35_011739 [Friedmanniomyces endolithicus]KAK0311759.1 hypothetical protein LTR82_014131 [Friedmanniomyces endolithicus]KAK0911004.1 hypothetical protein LTR57_015638 [Friedmanniomyces endolithicus]KAK0983615.1 hypothetical protein LTR54_014280 [Friedmanniomyces endolithicus]
MSTSTPDTLEMAPMPPSLARSHLTSPTTTTDIHEHNTSDPGFTVEPREDRDLDGGSTTTHEDANGALDSDRPLEDGGMSRERDASATSPAFEPDRIRKSRDRTSIVFQWLLAVIGLHVLVYVLVPAAYLIYVRLYPQLSKPSHPPPPTANISLTHFPDDLGPLPPPSSLTRFAGAVHATPDGNALYVPSPALDSHGRRFTGPPSPDVDAAWHDLIYGRYVRFSPWEVAALNRASDVPVLTPLPITDYLASPESDGNNDTILVPQEGFYGGPDMLHSLHCIHTLYKHFNRDYYGDTMTRDFERLHIDHCLDQLRQAVLCHGDMTPVTLRPVRNAKGEQWALLGETEREHVCRDGEALGREWREKGEERGRVETDLFIELSRSLYRGERDGRQSPFYKFIPF